MYTHQADPWVQVGAVSLEMHQITSDASSRINPREPPKQICILASSAGEMLSTKMERQRLKRRRRKRGRVASQLAALNLVSSPLSVNRWKWAITLFDVARQNFYHPTSLLLLLDLSADFKAPLLPPLSLSSHFNPLQQSPSVQSAQEHPLLTQKKKKNCNPNFFSLPPSSLCWVAITALLARWPAPAIN